MFQIEQHNIPEALHFIASSIKDVQTVNINGVELNGVTSVDISKDDLDVFLKLNINDKQFATLSYDPEEKVGCVSVDFSTRQRTMTIWLKDSKPLKE